MFHYLLGLNSAPLLSFDKKDVSSVVNFKVKFKVDSIQVSDRILITNSVNVSEAAAVGC